MRRNSVQVFGLGQSKAYPTRYQAVGKAMDNRLEELGAQRIFGRGEGDDSEEYRIPKYLPTVSSLLLIP